MKIRNPLIVRILIGLFIAAIIVILVVVTVNTMKNYTYLTYDVGEKNGIYNDAILLNFEDYKKIIDKYEIKQELNEASFATKSYIATFQEYDSCAESKYKTIESVEMKEDNTIQINFLYHNRCGMCKKHMVLYFIQIGKLSSNDYKLAYGYDLGNQVNCGTI